MRKALIVLVATLLLVVALAATASADAVVNPGNACAQPGGNAGITKASTHGGQVLCIG